VGFALFVDRPNLFARLLSPNKGRDECEPGKHKQSTHVILL
jgi:hypothetical protein